jgi:hypothetical protein
VGAVLIGIALLVYYLRKRINDKFIVVAFWVVSGLFLSVLFVFPVGITLLKLVGIIKPI